MNNREQISTNPLQLSVTTAQVDTPPSASVSSPCATTVVQTRVASLCSYQGELVVSKCRKKHAVSEGVVGDETASGGRVAGFRHKSRTERNFVLARALVMMSAKFQAEAM